jgi:hypothetical protein
MQNATLFNVMNVADLQKLPVDFHILGSTDNKLGFAWYAAGVYVNDDGITTSIEGNFNKYSIAAMASIENP